MGELLEWKDHDKLLSTKLWEFFKEEYLVDFSVTCHGQQTKVHKFVLALLFPILKESLRSTPTLSPNQEVVIPQAQGLNLDNIAGHPEDMDYLIQFAYTGKTTVPKEHADCLMHIADCMEIKSLKESLDQWDYKSKPPNKNDENDKTPESRQTRSAQIKKELTEESVDIAGSDENGELYFHSIIDEESSPESIEYSKVCSDDDDNNDADNDDDDDDTDYDKDIIINGCDLRSGHYAATQKRLNQEPAIRKVQRRGARKIRRKYTKLEKRYMNNKKGELIKCSECDFVAKYPSKMERHLKSHARKLGTKRFLCKMPKKEVERKILVTINGDKKYKKEALVCPYCGHKSSKKQTLIQHIKVLHHFDADGNPIEKDIKCDKCDYVCYANHQLRAHVRSKHDRLNMFKCKDCDFTAPYIHFLLKHERLKHQNRKDFACQDCGKQYQSNSSLTRHVMITHQGVKPYQCNICSIRYTCSFKHRIHMLSHEGNPENLCRMCGVRFENTEELRIHKLDKHGYKTDSTNRCQFKLIKKVGEVNNGPCHFPPKTIPD